MSELTLPNTKKTSRRKPVDLAAVAQFLDQPAGKETTMPLKKEKQSAGDFSLNEELIEATSNIKNQRDLIAKRMEKMIQSRDKVSKAVFEKVQRDYQVQLQSIHDILNNKKALVKDELNKLYIERSKQMTELNRHKEILEEAQFRHYLEEFSEEQFKEVESFETKEIQARQAEISRLESFVKLHEDLFDQADLPAKQTTSFKEPTTSTTEVEELQAPIVEDIALEATAVVSPEAIVTPVEIEKPIESAKTTVKPGVSAAEELFYESTLDPLGESNYFEANTGSHLIPPDDLTPPAQSLSQLKAASTSTAETIIRPTASNSEPESILDVLEDIELPQETKVADSALNNSYTPTPLSQTENGAAQTSIAPTATNGFKLVFLEMESPLDFKEFQMKDNISIGRSPSNDLVLRAPKVSRQHAAINKYKDQYLLIDLKSSNGVFVNGRKIDEHALSEGDEISIGGYRMKFGKN